MINEGFLLVVGTVEAYSFSVASEALHSSRGMSIMM